MPKTLIKRTAIVRGRIEGRRKKIVEGIFRRMGLTHTEALNLFYAQVEINQGLPFLVTARPHLTLENASLSEIEDRYKDKIPNTETQLALKEARHSKKLKAYRNIKQMMEG